MCNNNVFAFLLVLWMHNVMNVLLIIMYTVYAYVKMKRCNSVNYVEETLMCV